MVAVKEMKNKYCALSKPYYYEYGYTIEKRCDAALFTSLHGLSCGYVDPTLFEYNKTGKLCRRPNCTCFDNKQDGQPQSDSGFSKDMATGMQLYFSTKPDAGLARRVQNYGNANKWTVCNAETADALLGKCLMPPQIPIRWALIERKANGSKGLRLHDTVKPNENKEYAAHLDILSILTQYKLTGYLTESSKKTILYQARREPNNLLYAAMKAKFFGNKEEVDEVAKRLLNKFPKDRLPDTNDWCEQYLWQRDEVRSGKLNDDWLPCPERHKVHTGTDFLMVAWVLSL
jgi:hypothetical protein